MIISHNIQAMNTNRITNNNINLHGKSREKVSSGYQINRAADHPAGLSLSEKMRRQVRGLNVGVENAKAGINFCMVADGALNDVVDMLQRVNQLSVQAENGTNSPSDQYAIQAEVEQILAEIDRIADTTTFNEIPVFRGAEETGGVVRPGTGGSTIEGDIPFTDFTIADVTLGDSPFDPNSDANRLGLQAVVNNNTAANGKIYNLIFGSGSTSYSSFRLTYQKDGADKNEIVNFRALSRLDEYEEGESPGGNWWKRSFRYTNQDGVDIKITQKITAHIPTDPAQEKYYNISYSFANESPGLDVTLDFMFNADTAYNDDDACEGYYINDGSGKRLDKWCMFTDGGSWSGSDPVIPSGTSNDNIKQNLPESFSIINAEKALAFSEKVSFVPGSEPNILSIGPWEPYDGIIDGSDDESDNRLAVYEWNYYDHLDDERSGLGGNAINRDVAFSLFWNRSINSGNTSELSFNYGIVDYKKDDNLDGIEITPDPSVVGPQRQHYGTKSIWIHSGNEAGSGIWLEVDEMNTEVLEINDLDLTTQTGAGKANVSVKNALSRLSLSRAKIGAQQNRLEHTVYNEENVAENVDAAESGIRDTDLSSEMTHYSNLSILLRMGETMIAEANQRIEKLLTVLQ